MVKKMIAGFGGAIALNILHEIIRKNFTNVPHINELGEEALLKMTDQTPFTISSDKIYAATLAGDILSNGLYYATTATQHNMASGLVAGIGAIALPKHIGLDETPVAANTKRKLMTVGYYVFGAVVTKLIYDRIN